MRSLAQSILVGTALVAAVVPAAAGECVTVRSNAPLVTPDGDARGAGSLELCVDRRLGPTAVVLNLSLDGKRLGYFMGRVGRVESASIAPFVQFKRLEDGALLVEGYVIRGRTGLESYRLQMKGEGRRHHYPDLLLESSSSSDDGSFRVALGGSTPTIAPVAPATSAGSGPDLVSDAAR